jgi:broad specificity phosphatase PhoE
VEEQDGYEMLKPGVADRVRKIVTPRKYLEAPVVESPVPTVSEITDEIKKAVMYTLRQTKGKTVLMDPKERAGIIAQLSRSMNLLTQMEKLDELDYASMDDVTLAAAAQRFLEQVGVQVDDDGEFKSGTGDEE